MIFFQKAAGKFKIWTSPSEMRDDGVLSMNQRNLNFISKYNKRSLFPFVDNKLITKDMAQKNNVKSSALIGTVENQQEIKRVLEIIGDYKEFCIKPACGSGGKGILVIKDKNEANGNFIKTSGQEISLQEIKRHLANIIAGLYSLGNRQDIAIIEELIHVDDIFTNISYAGVPDLRVIVFKGYPVMCMLRLSTKESDGKANLHQGAVGLGICIKTGKAVRAVQHNQPVEKHPDTGAKLSEFKMPYWKTILTLAASCYEMTELGYIGADLVLDRDKGPMLLELNARPGLAIQICNNAGLLPRLKLIEEFSKKHNLNIEERVAFSMNHFEIFRE